LRIPLEAAPAIAAPAWIDIDLDAIAHNTRGFRRLLAPACRLVAVVKSNAYGHGMVRVARTALQNGAQELAVASVHEGAQLRAAGITQPILIAGPVVPLDLRTLYLKDLTLLGCTVTTPAVFTRLLNLIQDGALHPLVRAVYPLGDIAVAQSDFLGKAQTGKIVLVP
jgi:NADPH:quinone reductase-like Zn-dependent oxidoreductase